MRRPALFLLLFTAPAAFAQPALTPLKLADSALEPVTWSELDGWATDDHAAAFATFRTSCAPVLRRGARAAVDPRPIGAALEAACRRAAALRAPNAAAARAFFEDNFRPMRIFKLGDSQGFLTGYYEPIV